MKLNQITNSFFLLSTLFLLGSCSFFKPKQDSPIGGNYSKDSGFYLEEKIPSGMVFIEKGTFTMGQAQKDVMGGIQQKPNSIHVQNFYLDEAEVTNEAYVNFLDWVERVFPPNDEKYKYIYPSVLPDTLVWLKELASDGDLPLTYLRHPAYKKYPVVGVSWLQANAYCKWRTDRVAEARLIKEGYMNNPADVIEEKGANHFSYEIYRVNSELLFDGDQTILSTLFTTNKTTKRVRDSASVDTNKFNLPKLNSPSFRLPTEAEWEYAAKADAENRQKNNLRGIKRYPWKGNTVRNTSSKYATMYANFKQKRGDYSGISGWSSDNYGRTAPVKSYKPNAFGLYDMAGNVNEWVYDVYRIEIDNEDNDLGFQRGNVIKKQRIDENGHVIVATYKDIEYDTLPNDKIVPKNYVFPGEIEQELITERDILMNPNIQKADNRDVNDGDLTSSKNYENQEEIVSREMYNSPHFPKAKIDEKTGKKIYLKDTKKRTTLIDNRSRVYKGGSWDDRPTYLDPATRRYLAEYLSSATIGFRCALGKTGDDIDTNGSRKASHK